MWRAERRRRMQLAQQRLRLLQLVAGDVALALAEVDLVAQVGQRVALPADLVGARGGQAARVDDRGIAAAAQVQPVAAQRVLVGGDVLLGGAVARLARDAHLGDLAAHLLAADERVRLAGGGVAGDAADVPHLLLVAAAGRVEKDVAARHPAVIVEQIGERQRQLPVADERRHPERLHVVRAGHHRDAPRDARGGLAGRRRRPLAEVDLVLPEGIDHVDHEVVAAAEEVHVVAAAVELDVVEVAAHRRRAGVLGHGAVVAAVPRGVLRGVARLAAIGGRVAGARLLRDDGGELAPAALEGEVAARGPGGERQRRQYERGHEPAVRSA